MNETKLNKFETIFEPIAVTVNCISIYVVYFLLSIDYGILFFTTVPVVSAGDEQAFWELYKRVFLSMPFSALPCLIINGIRLLTIIQLIFMITRWFQVKKQGYVKTSKVISIFLCIDVGFNVLGAVVCFIQGIIGLFPAIRNILVFRFYSPILFLLFLVHIIWAVAMIVVYGVLYKRRKELNGGTEIGKEKTNS